MPTADFPASVLQSSLKLTQEPPKGLKANLTRSYADMEAEAFEACTKPAPYKKLLFGLAFFNAVIQERRKYGAVGWNIPYQWMASDFAFAQQNLGLMLDEQPSTPFEALNVIISDVVYGGRVTDAQDVRLTRAVLSTYLNADAVDDDEFSFCPQVVHAGGCCCGRCCCCDARRWCTLGGCCCGRCCCCGVRRWCPGQQG